MRQSDDPPKAHKISLRLDRVGQHLLDTGTTDPPLFLNPDRLRTLPRCSIQHSGVFSKIARSSTLPPTVFPRSYLGPSLLNSVACHQQTVQATIHNQHPIDERTSCLQPRSSAHYGLPCVGRIACLNVAERAGRYSLHSEQESLAVDSLSFQLQPRLPARTILPACILDAPVRSKPKTYLHYGFRTGKAIRINTYFCSLFLRLVSLLGLVKRLYP